MNELFLIIGKQTVEIAQWRSQFAQLQHKNTELQTQLDTLKSEVNKPKKGKSK